MNDIAAFIVDSGCILREALRRLDEAGEGILLLVDRQDGKLLRTVTDGDIRRLLIRGASLDDMLAGLPPAKPKIIHRHTDEAEALRLMNEFQINHIPVVDEDNRPVAIVLRREIDERILLSTPHLGDYEMGFVEEAFRTNWIAPLGPNVDAFERELAGHVGIGHAAAVSSGTAALHLALRVRGLGGGVPFFSWTLTFGASANPFFYVGPPLGFTVSERAPWNMRPQA